MRTKKIDLEQIVNEITQKYNLSLRQKRHLIEQAEQQIREFPLKQQLIEIQAQIRELEAKAKQT